MSLQVWLPLNKNLNNYGVKHSEVTATDATLSTSIGKIGGSYSFNGSSAYLLGTQSSFSNNTEEWSFACWVRLNTTSVNQCIFSCRTIADQRGISIFYFGSQQWAFDDGVRFQFNQSTSIATNTWYHICAVRKKGVGKFFYVNGVLDGSTTETGTPSYVNTSKFSIGGSMGSATAVTGNYVNGYINDVRIYDHALSVAEVRELAKGLVCHYKLDNTGKGNDNLVARTNTADTSRFGYSEQTGGSTKTIEYDNGTPCIKVTRNSTTHSGWAYMWNTGLATTLIKTSTTYTVSFDAIASGNGTVSFNGFMQGNATNNMSASTQVIQGAFNATKWSHIVLRTTTKDSFDSITIGSQVVYMGCSYLNNTGVWLMIKNMKVEEGSTDTGWCPYSTDDKYTRLDFGSTTVADNSGFGNNGTKVGTITNSSDAPRYSSSTNFNNSGYIINSAFNLKSNAFTVNLWVNPRTTSAQHFLFGSFSTWPNNGLGVYRDAGSNTRYQCVMRSDGESSYSAKTMTVTLNTWNMLTITYSGTVYTGYINGVKSFEVTYGASGIVSHYNIMIGNSKYNSTPASENEEAHVSDFRLYATCLSADDVKRLYNTPASVSKIGQFFGCEFNEVME